VIELVTGRPSARRLFAVAVTIYGLGFLGWLLWPAFRDSFIGGIVGIPPFSIYLFEHFGVPGLTDPKNCDWMWCKPTMFGTIFIGAVWLGAAWLVSIGIAHLGHSRWMRTGGRSTPPPGSVD
jgi:hypothetical protein